MLLVITGEVKSGKTEFLMKLVKKLPEMKIAGIIAPTIMKKGEILGYEALILPYGVRVQHVARKGEGERVGRRYVLLTGAKSQIVQHLKKPPDVDIYVFDEFGPLELSGKGLLDVFNTFYRSGKDMVVVVRKSILDRFFDFIDKKEVTVVEVGEIDPVEMAQKLKKRKEVTR